MSSLSPYTPSIGALMGYGMRTLAQSLAPAPTPRPIEASTSGRPVTQTDIATALKGALSDQPAVQSNTRFSSVSITLNNGRGLDVDNAARLLSPKPASGTATSLRGVEIINSATATTVGEHHGLASSGLAPVWLENRGSITGKNGAGVKLGGNHNDEVINAGLIAGSDGLALDMGEGNDLLIVNQGGRFTGRVDGGTGTNQVILDAAEGGTFQGARNMQHLWVSGGTWTLEGDVGANQQGKVYSGATLTNKKVIGGLMDVEAGATYSGGTVTNLKVAGTLQLEPATRIDKDLHMQAGSTLEFTLGRDSALSVGNTVHLDGATLEITVTNEHDALSSKPVRIIGAKQVEGKFKDLHCTPNTLNPVLTYEQGDVFVTFKRNA